MNEAIQRYLDDAIEPSELAALMATLTDAQRSELVATRLALHCLENLPREPVPPALVRKVMAAVTRQQPGLWARLRLWLQDRPALGWQAAGLAVAGWILSVSVVPMLPSQPSGGGSGGGVLATRQDAPEAGRVVQLSLYSPHAQSVALIGDFNGWGSKSEIRLTPSAPGVWSVSINLPAGQHQYAYLVDGRHWVADPRARQQLSDDFGRRNAVLTVL